MSDPQARFDFDAEDPLDARDAAARRRAVDPSRNVALEASAGTGKTRVLVDRYVALVAAGVRPRNILAITFTRKAAVEMRQRILQEIARRQREQTLAPDIWREIRENLSDIGISTIDAFCLSLLREFPLEADVDPGFELADETETPRLVRQALDRTLAVGRALAADEADVALLFAELGELRLREGLARLIDRRLVAWDALARFLRGAPRQTLDECVTRLLARLRAAFASLAGGSGALIDSGPAHPDFDLLVRDLRELLGEPPPSAAATQALLGRLREHVLTQSAEPRKRLPYKKAEFRSTADFERHTAAVAALGPYLVDALRAYREDVNVVLARVVQRLLAVALDHYQRTLHKHGVLDFSDVLQRTLALLAQMDEFSRSRFRLEARYQHVLVDEFQDTSRAQWELVERLVASWTAGSGLSTQALQPSLFIVGDRKQSIYGFRDAEVALLDEAARYISALRSAGPVRLAITRNFRSVREILAFTNDLFDAIDKTARPDAFRYGDDDVFPLASVDASDGDALGLIAAPSDEAQAAAMADEIAGLLTAGALVRDRDSGLRRAIRPGDIAVLFRTRDGHRRFEDALAARGVPFYVYKGLGFFDSDEIKDILALLTFLARPESELAAAALLRSRVVHLSDEALKLLAPRLAAAIAGTDLPPALERLHDQDRLRLGLLRAAIPRWLELVDRLPPSELLDRVLAESAYAAEIRGAAHRQAHENVKKVRGLIRRLQNRGYATLGRIVEHFAELVAGGDESNAIVDAVDAVNLMTTHAAKGLEFPVVFVANMQRGSGGGLDPVRVVDVPASEGDIREPSVAIGDHETAADRDVEAREAEEGKRLLYVALTRARDRLYLSATLNQDGQLAAGTGGLGRTLPVTVAGLFAEAAASSGRHVSWVSAAGSHRFRNIRPAVTPVLAPARADQVEPRTDDFTALESTGPRRLTMTSPRRDLDGSADDDVLWRRYGLMLSMRTGDGTINRVVIDCVVKRRDGDIDVIRFTSGPPGEDDRAALQTQIDAAVKLFAGSSIRGRLQQLSSGPGV
jgi:ATP-dependent helicase/nuclease subunit A